MFPLMLTFEAGSDESSVPVCSDSFANVRWMSRAPDHVHRVGVSSRADDQFDLALGRQVFPSQGAGRGTSRAALTGSSGILLLRSGTTPPSVDNHWASFEWSLDQAQS